MNTFNLAGLVRIALTGEGPAHRYLSEELAYFASQSQEAPDLEIAVGPFEMPRGDRVLLSNRAYTVGSDWCAFTSAYRCVRWKTMLRNVEGRPLRVELAGGRLAGRVFLLKILIPLIRHLLHRSNATLVKASAVAEAERATILAGWSGSGKTSAALALVEVGFDYLSDTFSILAADGAVHPMPLLVHLFGRNVTASVRSRLAGRRKCESAIKNVLFRATRGAVNLSVTLPFKELFPERKVAPSAKIERFVLLSPHSENPPAIKPLKDKGTALKRVLCTEKFESADFELARLAYLHVNPDGAFAGYWEDAARILRAALEKARLAELSYSGPLDAGALALLRRREDGQ